jgi:hypothetical protein
MITSRWRRTRRVTQITKRTNIIKTCLMCGKIARTRLAPTVQYGIFTMWMGYCYHCKGKYISHRNVTRLHRQKSLLKREERPMKGKLI